MQRDGIHPNADGARQVEALVMKSLANQWQTKASRTKPDQTRTKQQTRSKPGTANQGQTRANQGQTRDSHQFPVATQTRRKKTRGGNQGGKPGKPGKTRDSHQFPGKGKPGTVTNSPVGRDGKLVTVPGFPGFVDRKS